MTVIIDPNTGMPKVPEGQHWSVTRVNRESTAAAGAMVNLIESSIVETGYGWNSEDWDYYGKFSGRNEGYHVQYNRINRRVVARPRQIEEPHWFRPSTFRTVTDMVEVSDVERSVIHGYGEYVEGPFTANDVQRAARTIMEGIDKRAAQEALYGEYPPKKLEVLE